MGCAASTTGRAAPAGTATATPADPDSKHGVAPVLKATYLLVKHDKRVIGFTADPSVSMKCASPSGKVKPSERDSSNLVAPITEAIVQSSPREALADSKPSVFNGAAADLSPSIAEARSSSPPRKGSGEKRSAADSISSRSRSGTTTRRQLERPVREVAASIRARAPLSLSSVQAIGGGFRWRKGELIGHGAVGAVYLGLNEENGSLMAVKEIRFSGATADAKDIAALQTEINVMR